MTKKALITGFTGMVGSHLADLLIKKKDLKFLEHVDGEVHKIILNTYIPQINKKEIGIEYFDLNDYSSIKNTIEKVRPDYTDILFAQSFPKSSFK